MPSAAFKRLNDFIVDQMRMSHVYQPVMLLELLDRKGNATTAEIAKAILEHDPTQPEYYEHVVKNMVGRVLTRNRGITVRTTHGYRLTGFDDLSQVEVQDLRVACQTKLQDYLEKHGARIWGHRRKGAGYISGSIKWEVLRRAKTRCEACGISNREKALEVDHIVPRARGGKDTPDNFQALCYSCNAMKQHRDATDFRQVRASFDDREEQCPFCNIPEDRLLDNPRELAYVLADSYPVTEGHCLIIPRRHVASYFDLHQAEINAVTALVQTTQASIRAKHSDVAGFNVGINAGEAAGQTVMHCHVHLIPRRHGDVSNPRGGVRWVIPGKGDYRVEE